MVRDLILLLYLISLFWDDQNRLVRTLHTTKYCRLIKIKEIEKTEKKSRRARFVGILLLTCSKIDFEYFNEIMRVCYVADL